MIVSEGVCQACCEAAGVPAPRMQASGRRTVTPSSTPIRRRSGPGSRWGPQTSTPSPRRSTRPRGLVGLRVMHRPGSRSPCRDAHTPAVRPPPRKPYWRTRRSELSVCTCRRSGGVDPTQTSSSAAVGAGRSTMPPSGRDDRPCRRRGGALDHPARCACAVIMRCLAASDGWRQPSLNPSDRRSCRVGWPPEGPRR